MPPVSDDEAGRQRALEVALEARLIMTCPHHPDVFVLVADTETAERPDLAPSLDQHLAGLPVFCPKCSDEDD
jgi:hypothetical protein